MHNCAPGEQSLHAAVPAAACLESSLVEKDPSLFPQGWGILMGRMGDKDSVP